MTIGDRNGVIVGVIPYERLGADPATRLIAGFERGGWQRAHHGQIALQSFADRLFVAAKDVALPPAALGFEIGVEGVPTGEAGDRHHVVPAGVTNHPLNIAFVVPLARSPIAVPEPS
jgi:hypothetical protein